MLFESKNCYSNVKHLVEYLKNQYFDSEKWYFNYKNLIFSLKTIIWLWSCKFEFLKL
jgi:hypothetical protein